MSLKSHNTTSHLMSCIYLPCEMRGLFHSGGRLDNCRFRLWHMYDCLHEKEIDETCTNNLEIVFDYLYLQYVKIDKFNYYFHNTNT